MREFDVFDPATLDDHPGYDRLLDQTGPSHRGHRFLRRHRVGTRPGGDAQSRGLLVAPHCGPDQDAAGRPTIFDMDGGGHAVHAGDHETIRSICSTRKLVLPTLVARRIRALEPQVQVATRERCGGRP